MSDTSSTAWVIIQYVHWWSWTQLSLPGSRQELQNFGKFILLFLWNDAWFVSGKPCSAWRWIMQFQPGGEKWQLRSSLSVNILYNAGWCDDYERLNGKDVKVRGRRHIFTILRHHFLEGLKKTSHYASLRAKIWTWGTSMHVTGVLYTRMCSYSAFSPSTSWSRVFLEQTIFRSLVKKFPSFYGTQGPKVVAE
jgi:hypothetical protein